MCWTNKALGRFSCFQRDVHRIKDTVCRIRNLGKQHRTRDLAQFLCNGHQEPSGLPIHPDQFRERQSIELDLLPFHTKRVLRVWGLGCAQRHEANHAAVGHRTSTKGIGKSLCVGKQLGSIEGHNAKRQRRLELPRGGALRSGGGGGGDEEGRRRRKRGKRSVRRMNRRIGWVGSRRKSKVIGRRGGRVIKV